MDFSNIFAYGRIPMYLKSHSFAALTRSISDTSPTRVKIPYARAFHEVISIHWKEIVNQDLWNFPHVVGAINGNNVTIKCRLRSGSQYYFFSILLLAICDAHYAFTLIDIGECGSSNDRDIFLNSLVAFYLSR